MAALLSKPQYLDNGEFEFVLHLEPSTSLTGIAPQVGTSETFVLVTDSAGRVVPAGTSRYAATDAAGRFQYDVVPVGPLTVKVGTWQQLELGVFSKLAEVDARRGQTAVAEF